MKDVKIDLEREIGMWWNAVVQPERQPTTRKRALLVRQCELECNKQIKAGKKKHKIDTSVEVGNVVGPVEIVID